MKGSTATGAGVNGHSKIIRHLFLFYEAAFRAGEIGSVFNHAYPSSGHDAPHYTSKPGWVQGGGLLILTTKTQRH